MISFSANSNGYGKDGVPAGISVTMFCASIVIPSGNFGGMRRYGDGGCSGLRKKCPVQILPREDE